MSFDLCPNCAIDGKVSELEYYQMEDRALVMCSDVDCSYNHEGHSIARSYGEAPISEWVLEALGLPLTLSNEPRMSYRHTKTIFWLNSIRRAVYLWCSEEVLSMAYATLPRVKAKRYRYSLTPSAKKLMELTEEEVFLGKQIIPDLVRLISTLKYYYRKCGFA